MSTKNLIKENIKKIELLFPQCITEVQVDGHIERTLDFNLLKQELGIDETAVERYQFTWPGKAKAKILANMPVNKSLRPCRLGSINFDATENIYIEGDNLEVLKLLRETYLGKIKMIYIDPPYNTGNDFVYNDNYAMKSGEFSKINDFDEYGNRLEKNNGADGQYHTNWLNMMYPRLRVARDLLSDDGIIFISIDDELGNLIKICNEIFGEQNFESCITWRRRTNQPNDKSKMIAKVSEYILVYSKNSSILQSKKTFNGVPLSEERRNDYKNPDRDPKGPWSTNPWKAATGRGGTKYTITTPTGKQYTETWYGNEETFNNLLLDNRVYWTDNGNGMPRIKIYLKDAELSGQAAINFFTPDRFGSNQEGSAELEQLLGIKGIFDNPKPTLLIKSLIQIATNDNDIILDFFSGSGTTADAVMQINKEQRTKRKYICVQIDEKTAENSIAFKNGYNTIPEIAKTRIKNAGINITKQTNLSDFKVDVGFRLLKLSRSNFKDVYVNPDKINQTKLDILVDNIEPDCTAEDLLFHVMLQLGIDLSATISSEIVDGKTIYKVNNGYIIACFDKDITENVVKHMAQIKEPIIPVYAIFRDSCMSSDEIACNYEQIFKTYGPEINVKTI